MDGVDRMLSFVDEGIDQAPEVDHFIDAADNDLSQYSKLGAGASERVYDDNGNRTNDGLGNGSLVFDTHNRLHFTLDAAGAPAWCFVYDAAGRLLGREDFASQEVVRYAFNGWQVLQEETVIGVGPTRQYVDSRGIDEHIQMRVIDPSGAHEDYFYHSNSPVLSKTRPMDSVCCAEHRHLSARPSEPTPLAGRRPTTRRGRVGRDRQATHE